MGRLNEFQKNDDDNISHGRNNSFSGFTGFPGFVCFDSFVAFLKGLDLGHLLLEYGGYLNWFRYVRNIPPGYNRWTKSISCNAYWYISEHAQNGVLILTCFP